MSIYKTAKIFTISVLSIISFSCTLNYSKEAKIFEKKPNFVFKNSNLDRYEENLPLLKINFERLEIYDTDKIWAGEKIYFVKTSSATGKNNLPQESNQIIESKGFAGLIKIDEKNEKYFLGNDVFFEDVKENLLISGKAFFWDKTANILFAPKDGIVTVKRGDEFNIKGLGFIANTLSREFEFTGEVLGNIHTDTNGKGADNDKTTDNPEE